MNKLKIRSKLLVSAIVPMLILLLISGIGISVSNQIRDDFLYISDQDLPLVEALSEIKFNTSRLISSANEYVLNGIVGVDEDEQESEAEDITEAIEALQTTLGFVAALVNEYYQEEIDDVTEIQTLVDDLVLGANRLVELQENNAAFEEIAEERESFEDIEREILPLIDGFIAEENAEIVETEATIIAAVNNYFLTVLVAGGIAVLIMLGLFVFAYQSVARPVLNLRDSADKLRAGDLQHRASVITEDEIGELAQAFNIMADSVQQRQAELKALNLSLEERIAERTLELKQARDDALESQRVAQENSRLKSEFLSTMSHELRTPLNAIEGFTSIMLSGMGVELSPRAEDMIKRVSVNSKRLLQLVNDFLDLSRIESGRLELISLPLAPSALARKWQTQLGVLAESKGLEFVVQVDPELPPTLLGDEDALSKIVVNLLGNAFKFTHRGQVTLHLQKIDANWAIAVSDTGIGIPPHAREYIFDEFRQVDSSSKRLYGGTGLGLALVKKLAREMKGSVNLQSEVGKGSTFTVLLPLEIPESSSEKVLI